MTVLILPLKAFICLRNKFKKEVLNLFKLICGKQKDRRIHQKEHFLVTEDMPAFERGPKDFLDLERALESIKSHIESFSL